MGIHSSAIVVKRSMMRFTRVRSRSCVGSTRKSVGFGEGSAMRRHRFLLSRLLVFAFAMVLLAPAIAAAQDASPVATPESGASPVASPVGTPVVGKHIVSK